MSDWWPWCMPPLVPTMPTRLPAARAGSSRARSSATVRISSTSLHLASFGLHAFEVELGQRLVAERAAVDGELRAGHVLRLVRREVHDAGGDVGGLTEARHHDVLQERGLVLLVLEDRGHRLRTGEDEPDDDRVGADVVLAVVDCELTRERVDGAFRRVVRGSVRERRLRRARRDVDDRTVAG